MNKEFRNDYSDFELSNAATPEPHLGKTWMGIAEEFCGSRNKHSIFWLWDSIVVVREKPFAEHRAGCEYLPHKNNIYDVPTGNRTFLVKFSLRVAIKNTGVVATADSQHNSNAPGLKGIGSKLSSRQCFS
ncbi:hypothetical protein B0H19DRAFT_1070434 [Mycena capillaripes]|nr:hypothetical protein B0H19DRAFT_1070434 [Mycena capillaripes]